mgnify:FL=1
MLTPPQRSNLPQVIEPRRLVNQGVILTGKIDRDLCVRLADAVIEISEPIMADLNFDVADQGRKVVHVSATTTVLIACQRCLEPIALPLAIDTMLGIVWSEDQAKSLPKELEPWVVEEEAGDIAALVEDELLLALPFVTFHPEDQCSVASHSTDSFSTDESLDGEGLEGKSNAPAKNPFSILEQLKK